MKEPLHRGAFFNADRALLRRATEKSLKKGQISNR